MSQVLILGGTGWLGRELAAVALSAGHDVTCLARGESGHPIAGVDLIRCDRERPDAHAAVADRDWDRVIELSWNNGFVTRALAALAERAALWTLVSTISVYASNSHPGADESDDLLEPGERGDEDDYGRAKVAVEQASSESLGDRLLIVRPGLIGGPGDPSDRFGYWVGRMARAFSEPVLSMQAHDRTAQVIDVRDLAEFVVRSSGPGIVNAVGHSLPLAHVLDRAARVAEFSGARIEAADDWLVAQDVNFWAGPRSLPLWLPPEDAPMMTRSNAAYLAAGGALRELDSTLQDTLFDERKRGLDRDRRAGLTRADETRLLEQLRA